ncbi:hypothetical protein HRbin36_02309 [bacterium HR36]|nr:hypothetical protein HRbin36_02309 [bacterium HR36]
MFQHFPGQVEIIPVRRVLIVLPARHRQAFIPRPNTFPNFTVQLSRDLTVASGHFFLVFIRAHPAVFAALADFVAFDIAAQDEPDGFGVAIAATCERVPQDVRGVAMSTQ